jgi:glycine/D-amino acid oxidase-like deaminating enzyme
VEVGVRPATRDRQPFVGNHPEYPQLAVFNGFGAKGSLLVPWFSERMIRFLLHQEALPVTADIRRYNA